MTCPLSGMCEVTRAIPTTAMPTAGPRRSGGRSRRTHFYGYPESHRQERIFINIGSYRMSAAKKKAAEAVV